LDWNWRWHRYNFTLSKVFKKEIMKFNHPQDTKMFLLGVLASMSAVIIWDVIKKKNKIFNYVEQKV
tara:strand:+ start:358 stop:555 length:198 start_codon:yes stop_codon:yes gene_type:complete